MRIKYLNSDFFGKNENVRAFFCSAHREKNMHSHEFWELSYIYEGRGKNYTNAESETVKDSNFLLIKPGMEHSVTSPKKNDGALVRVCNCLFTQDYFDSLIKEYTVVPELNSYALHDMLLNKDPFCIKLSDDNAHNIRHLMWLIAHEYNHFTAGSELIIRHSMLDLIISITRLYEYQTKNAAPTVSRSAEIDELMKYMRSNFGYKLTLDFLASHVHLSREYLSRYFKQYTGKTISEFLLEVRISRAKQMLRTSSYSVSDIGAYCGYPSVSNFQKAFKKAEGISPSQYRKKNSVKMQD
ncbi:MAG: AraC family transcriptional regulator [Candidatus Ornithomonoglobus sp.]